MIPLSGGACPYVAYKLFGLKYGDSVNLYPLNLADTFPFLSLVRGDTVSCTLHVHPNICFALKRPAIFVYNNA